MISPALLSNHAMASDGDPLVTVRAQSYILFWTLFYDIVHIY